jgi:hypothetical protein
MMRKKLFIYIIIILLLLLIGSIFCAWRNTIQAQEIIILDGGNQQIYNITYYSSINGRWLNAIDHLTTNHTQNASLQNKNPFKTAAYQIAVGNRIGRFYCTADIKNPALGGKPSFTGHHGHCQTFITQTGQLALTVDKAN